MGLPLDLEFRTKGQLAIDIMRGRRRRRDPPDFFCGDEVYGNCTQLREYLEAEGQAYVLRVPSNFTLTLAGGHEADLRGGGPGAAERKRRWEVRSAGAGSKGERWYAWAWIATASARHHLLVRRHLRPASWPFTTASCPKASCWPRPG